MRFEKVSKKDWLEKVEKDLKGKPIEGLDWSLNGKSYSPFFHKDDNELSGLTSNRESNTWQINTDIQVNNVVDANKVAKECLMYGANSVCFYMDSHLDKAHISDLLEGIHSEWIHTQFVLKNIENPLSFVKNYHAVLTDKGENTNEISCAFNVQKVNESVRNLFPRASMFRIVERITTENSFDLGEVLIEASDYLNKISTQEISWSIENGLFEFHLYATDDYFTTISKTRALRILWAQLLEAYKLPFHPAIISIAINQNTFENDENTNKIKSTSQAMAAAIAGADRITIPASNINSSKNFDRFNTRIATNIHHLMQMESYLDNVVDPSAGSYFIEKLTNDIALKAWSELQQQ